MMVWAINLVVLAIGILIVGIFKPQWIIFWLEKPGRMPIVILSSILFMAGAVMFGEASREKKQLENTQQKETTQNNENTVPIIEQQNEVVAE